ncbi:MAG: methionyl-tRNA formyltransferase [Myxococcales bacterium]|nr:methionyl-tRNA formyltransferase [Myxococcales bacterium]
MAFRALFFGSPSFAVPSLDALHEIADVAAVVCQPDKPAGRGLALTEPAVKTRARALGLPVVQPTKLRTGEFGAWVRGEAADVALVVAYGRILPADVLAATGLGFVNVHASLLPRYRGAAPITWAVVNGDAETGVSLMKLDEGMDTGPTFARVRTPIGPDETAGEVSERLARLGADAVRAWLPEYVAGRCVLEAQDAAGATLAPVLEKGHGRVDWSKKARAVHDHVRGMSPWPGAFTTARGRTIKVHATRVVGEEGTTAAGAGGGAAALPVGAAGEVIVADKSRLLVACGGGGCVELRTVQPEGKRAMTGAEWVMGRGVAQGDVLGR